MIIMIVLGVKRFRGGNPIYPRPLALRYIPGMTSATVNEVLARMTPEEIRDGLWFLDVCERSGNMDQEEADEWRRRILARQRFLALDTDGPQAGTPTH